jgi:hypothetical protein
MSDLGERDQESFELDLALAIGMAGREALGKVLDKHNVVMVPKDIVSTFMAMAVKGGPGIDTTDCPPELRETLDEALAAGSKYKVVVVEGKE